MGKKLYKLTLTKVRDDYFNDACLLTAQMLNITIDEAKQMLNEIPCELTSGISFDQCIAIDAKYHKIGADTKATEDELATEENNSINIDQMSIDPAREIVKPQLKYKPRPIPHNINVPRCPNCGSTAITTTARGVNWTWGLIGASKTVNRCGNCGHTWKPKG